MPLGLFPNCVYCTRYRNGPREDTVTMYCDAFPEGIPTDIHVGRNEHTRPVSGDHGLQFQLERGREERFKEYVQRRRQWFALQDAFADGRLSPIGPPVRSNATGAGGE